MKLKDTGLTAQDIKDKVKKYMIETYERFDFIAETAEGMYLYDENGTPYLDFYAGIAVNNAGSRNPKVVAAVKDQVDDIMHTFNYPYTIPQALLAEKVCKTIGMDKIFYQNSGTEANEAMIIEQHRLPTVPGQPAQAVENNLGQPDENPAPARVGATDRARVNLGIRIDDRLDFDDFSGAGRLGHGGRS